VVAAPAAGKHYPRSYADLMSWFGTDADCLDYLDWLRWPDGFVCPSCAAAGGWRTGDGRWMCASCSKRTSTTAGTTFDRSRTPLTVWFAAAWQLATRKDGVSALGLQRSLGMASYQTTWAMLHRLRSAMVRPGRERLTGQVEVDEAVFGGVRVGTPGGRGGDGRVLVAVAVEHKASPGKGFGRCRFEIIEDAKAPTLKRFLTNNVEPGSTVLTDGLSSYGPATAGIYTHERYVAPGPLAHELLPGVHRVISLVKRWLLGTHQGAIEADHLQAYLDEFAFRFNRRSSRSPGMLFYRLLEQAVAHEPLRYRDIVGGGTAHREPVVAPPGGGGHPTSLETDRVRRPWRAA
jgi:transposase-like protein